LAARARDTGGNTRTSANVSVTVSNSGLVLALNFNETSGTTVTDLSGFANNGTIGGATRTTAGKYGRALSFNGSSNFVTVGDSATLDLTNAMTLEAWVNVGSATGYRTVLLKERTGDLAYALY